MCIVLRFINDTSTVTNNLLKVWHVIEKTFIFAKAFQNNKKRKSLNFSPDKEGIDCDNLCSNFIKSYEERNHLLESLEDSKELAAIAFVKYHHATNDLDQRIYFIAS